MILVSAVSAHTERATRNTLDISAVPILKKEHIYQLLLT
ncbi:hypothetical protein ACT7CW_02670 [Bacillus pacificus]